MAYAVNKTSKEYVEGVTAHRQNKGVNDCPYKNESQARIDWIAGLHDIHYSVAAPSAPESQAPTSDKIDHKEPREV